jgi:hypothetical protein
MTFTNAYLPILIPTFAVLLGIFLNNQAINNLRSEIIQLRDNIHRDMVGLHERIVVVETKQERS